MDLQSEDMLQKKFDREFNSMRSSPIDLPAVVFGCCAAQMLMVIFTNVISFWHVIGAVLLSAFLGIEVAGFLTAAMFLKIVGIF